MQKELFKKSTLFFKKPMFIQFINQFLDSIHQINIIQNNRDGKKFFYHEKHLFYKIFKLKLY